MPVGKGQRTCKSCDDAAEGHVERWADQCDIDELKTGILWELVRAIIEEDVKVERAKKEACGIYQRLLDATHIF